MNGRVEPKYRHDLSSLLMESYCEVFELLIAVSFCDFVNSLFSDSKTFFCFERLGNFRICIILMDCSVELL